MNTSNTSFNTSRVSTFELLAQVQSLLEQTGDQFVQSGVATQASLNSAREANSESTKQVADDVAAQVAELQRKAAEAAKKPDWLKILEFVGMMIVGAVLCLVPGMAIAGTAIMAMAVLNSMPIGRDENGNLISTTDLAAKNGHGWAKLVVGAVAVAASAGAAVYGAPALFASTLTTFSASGLVGSIAKQAGANSDLAGYLDMCLSIAAGLAGGFATAKLVQTSVGVGLEAAAQTAMQTAQVAAPAVNAAAQGTGQAVHGSNQAIRYGELSDLSKLIAELKQKQSQYEAQKDQNQLMSETEAETIKQANESVSTQTAHIRDAFADLGKGFADAMVA